MNITKRLTILISVLTITAIAFAIAVLLRGQAENTLEVQDIFAVELEKKIHDNGLYDYEYSIEAKRQIDDYNLLRHFLSTYALLEYYDNKGVTNEKKKIIESAIDYALKSLVTKDDNTMYIVEDDEIKLGTISMAGVTFCKYEKVYNDTQYHDIMIKLSNGILEMQRMEGRFNHIFNQNYFSFREKDRIIYYEGEAALALCRAYEITKDEAYLNSAKKAMNYYIENHYESYMDHWQEYAAYEMYLCTKSEKYLDYALENVYKNFNSLVNKNKFDSTDFEVLRMCLLAFREYKENEYKNEFTVSIVQNELEKRREALKKEVEESIAQSGNLDSFFLKRGQKTIRIDDLAHFLLGSL